MTVLVTGAAGFMGRHLCVALEERGDRWVSFEDGDSVASLLDLLGKVDGVVHLAGVNRPQDPAEFDSGNRGLTVELLEACARSGFNGPLVFSSSTQATLENEYGRSKKAAEEAFEAFSKSQTNAVTVYRFTNVFGKWAKPNYNSAVATFAHNIANGLPIQINDPARIVKLIYIDDAVRALLAGLNRASGFELSEPGPTYEITLQELADTLYALRDARESLVLPDLAPVLTRHLYATLYSYFDEVALREYSLQQRTDERGTLAEFLKSPHFGQIFVSRTKPGVTRGNHYHHSKPEKFLVLEGDAVVRFRKLGTDEVQEHRVTGHDFRVIDITQGWVHSIENVGESELVTLFWAGEVFDPKTPDTIFQKVIPE
jgi:UDP-2-acetamido-2,6-beta-L-arabino-hexul-4-ose reductase